MIFNVRDYGATGNGVTDDKLAIQAAINAAKAAGGGEVYIPAGTYAVTGGAKGSTGAIQIFDNITVYGDGMGQTMVKVKDGWSGDITGIFRTPTDVVTQNVGMHDLTIDGNRANVTGKIDGWFNGVKPGKTDADVNITLDHIEIKDCPSYGFDPHERTINLTITNSISHGNGLDGFTLDFQIGAHIENNVAYDNDRHGFNIVTSTNNIQLINNIVYDNGSQGIMIQRGSDDIPVPNNILIQGGSIYGNVGDGIQINKSDRVTVDGVDIYDNGQRGVRIMGSIGSIIQNSHIHDNAQVKDGGYEEIRIQNYDDTAGVSGRIYITKDTQILNNKIEDAGAFHASYAIREIADGTDYTTISNNLIWGTRKDFPALTGSHSVISDSPFVLNGTNGAETIAGANNHDTLNGLGGNDTLYGQGGNDTMDGGANNDKLYGGEGKDNMSGGTGDDILYGGNGDDSLNGKTGMDQLYGEAGNDKLVGGTGNDTLDGGVGNDYLDGGEANDTLKGGAGLDIFQFASGFGVDTILDFTQGQDKLNISSLLAANFTQFTEHVTVEATKTVITFGADRIELNGFTAPLHEADVNIYG